MNSLKTIVIKLNNMDFRYDIYQLFNIFYNFYSIEFLNENWNYSVDVLDDTVVISDGVNLKRYEFFKGLRTKQSVKKAVFEYLSQKEKKEISWGTLVGIRPSKIALELLKDGKNCDQIIEYFKYHYDTRYGKAKLCVDIAKLEDRFVNKNKNNISIYIDMPFCPTRCLYCSFASNPIDKCKKIVPEYLKCLFIELNTVAEYVNRKKLNVECIYFGGGTPTSISDEQFEKVMYQIYNSFVLKNHVREFTVECGRPDSITLSKLESMKKYKVDRISINPQTMNDETLKLIGRRHTAWDVADKFYTARNLGFENINMDIIVGLPGEGLHNIKKTCESIKELDPDNLTVHGLSVKRGSRLHENMVNNINFAVPEQHELNLMYDETINLSKNMDMSPYYMYRQKNMVGNMENIGYAKRGKESLYNIQMIEEKQTIIACGADAVTKVVFPDENRIERHFNVKDVREYIKRIREMIDKKIELLDTLYK